MKKLFHFLLILIIFHAQAQVVLQPGFSGPEYRQMLQIFSRQTDLIQPGYEIPEPSDYERVFRSGIVGLKNRWDLWYRKDHKLAVISLRGTVGEAQSWLENFYAAMVPAIGNLRTSDSSVFQYKLSNDPMAMVHIGWLLGLAYLSPTIIQELKVSYENGYHEFIIMGHSQGGALAYLLTSYLFYLQMDGTIPRDIKFKTYCSAAPKPGNLFYAYDFDFITRNGWAFNVVNAVDWVPQTPFSIQTLRDFSTVNPFRDIGSLLGKQPFYIKWYLKSKFRKMDKSTSKAQKRFQDYLGKLAEKQVRKALPKFQPPVYSSVNNYQRAAVPIVLEPDSAYFKKFPDNMHDIFSHHLLEPYYYLSKLYYP